MTSRPKRWGSALANAQNAMEELEEAFGELNSLKEEYDEWFNNLPDNLQYNSTISEKLEAIVELDFESALGDARSVIDDAEACELPLGFGRD